MGFQPYDDPGWFSAFKGSKSGDGAGVVTIRKLFLSLAATPLLMLYVMTQIFERVGSPDPLLAGVLVAVGLGGLAVASRSRSRPLAGSTSDEVAAAYRTSFFVGFVGSEAPLLVGFAAAFVTDELWPYLAVLPFFFVGMSLIAPTRRNLERRDEQLQRRGSPVSLRAVLNEPLAERVNT